MDSSITENNVSELIGLMGANAQYRNRQAGRLGFLRHMANAIHSRLYDP